MRHLISISSLHKEISEARKSQKPESGNVSITVFCNSKTIASRKKHWREMIMDVDFINCSFMQTSFVAVDFVDVNFINCEFCRSSFINCDFKNCKFAVASEDKNIEFLKSYKKSFINTSFINCGINFSSIDGNGNVVFMDARAQQSRFFVDTYNPDAVFSHNIESLAAGQNRFHPDLVPRLPDGTLVGYKKLRDNVIAVLEIPKSVVRSKSFGKKCRAERVIVRKMYIYVDEEGQTAEVPVGVSLYDERVIYETGKTVVADSFDLNSITECSHGIHFFLNEDDARNFRF